MSEHIQIGAVAPRIQHAGDGVTTTFVYPFPIFAVADLAIYLDDSKQSSGFTVDGAGASAGGSATFDVAPADGVTVTLAREIAIARTSDFQEGGEFRAQVLNDELDYLTAALQQVADDVDRAVTLSPTDPSSGLVVPDIATRANRFLAFDTAGQILAAVAPEGGNPVSAFMASVLDDGDAAAARTTLGAAALSAAQTFAKSQRGTVQTLTDAATIAWDMAEGNHAAVTLTADRTLGNPANVVAGQAGTLRVAGAFSITAFGSFWEFAGGVVPEGTAGEDLYVYFVKSSSEIIIRLAEGSLS